jgi:hypothetical protein
MPDVLAERKLFIFKVKGEEHKFLIEISQVLKGEGVIKFVFSKLVFESVEIRLGFFVFFN